MSTDSVKKVEQQYGYGSREAQLAREREANRKAEADIEAAAMKDLYVDTQFPERRDYYIEIDHPKTPAYTIATVHNYWSQGGYTDVNGNYVGAKFFKVLYKFIYGPFKSMGDAELNLAKLNKRNREAGLPEDSWATQLDGKWYVQFLATTKLSDIDDRMDKLQVKVTADVRPEFDPAKDRIAALEKALKDAEARAVALQAELDKLKNQSPKVVEKVVQQPAPAPQIIERVTIRTQYVQSAPQIVDKTAQLRAEDMLKKAKIAFGTLPGDPYSTLQAVRNTGRSGNSESIRKDLEGAQSLYAAGNFSDAESAAMSVYEKAKAEALSIFDEEYKATYNVVHSWVENVDEITDPEQANAKLDTLEAYVRNDSETIRQREKWYETVLANTRVALNKDINRGPVYSQVLLDEIAAKRLALDIKLKTTHAIDAFINLSDTEMAAKNISYTEYISKRTTLTGQPTSVIATKSTANDAKVKKYLGVCAELLNKGLVNRATVEGYFKAITKTLRCRAVSFEDAYAIEQRYGMVGAASMAILMAYNYEGQKNQLQNMSAKENIFVSVFQLNQILKVLGK